MVFERETKGEKINQLLGEIELRTKTLVEASGKDILQLLAKEKKPKLPTEIKITKAETGKESDKVPGDNNQEISLSENGVAFALELGSPGDLGPYPPERGQWEGVAILYLMQDGSAKFLRGAAQEHEIISREEERYDVYYPDPSQTQSINVKTARVVLEALENSAPKS